MGNNSGTEKTTTQSQSNSQVGPWGPSETYLKSMLGEANALHSGGVGSKIYRGSTVIPWSAKTQSGMSDMFNIAGENQSAMGKPVKTYSSMMDMFTPIASGDFSNDTTFQNNLGAAQRDARTAVNLGMGSAGRFGSGTHAKTLATAVGDLTNQAMLERQSFGNEMLTRYGNSMPSAFQTALMPTQTKMDVGAMDEDLASRLKQDELRIFDAEQNVPWEALARANAIFSGAGQMGNVSSTNSTGTVLSPNYRPTFGQQALGFGTTLAGSAMKK